MKYEEYKKIFLINFIFWFIVILLYISIITNWIAFPIPVALAVAFPIFLCMVLGTVVSSAIVGIIISINRSFK